MARKRVEYTEEQRAEIERAIKESSNKLGYRRLLILKAAGDVSRTNKELAQDFQASDSMVGHLISEYLKSGLSSMLCFLLLRR